MKVEYLHQPDRRRKQSIIRIFNFNRDELRGLRRAFARLARGNDRAVAVSSLPGIHCIDGIELMLERSDWDVGILERTQSGKTFNCRLSRDGWLEANGKAKAIERAIGPGKSNDLNADGDILLLLSCDGAW